jgi:capsular polysaccharide biosynthesis protein
LEIAEILKTMRRHWVASTLTVVIAFGAALGVRLASHNVPTGAATVQILVDSPSSELANLTQNPTPLISRAAVFAQVMSSQAVIQEIATAAHVPVGQITAQGPYTGAAENLNVITPSEARSNQLVVEKAIYRITLQAQQNEPVITTTVQAPTPASAAQIANAVFAGVQHYVATIQQSGHTPEADRVTLRQLGSAQTASVNGGSRGTLTIAAFLGIMLVGLLAILGIEAMRKHDDALESIEHDLEAEFESVAHQPESRLPLASAGERRR